MPRRWLTDFAVFTLLVTLGFASRMAKEALGLSLPNFHAVTAVSLFAGFYFAGKGAAGKCWALATPLAAMAICDGAFGGYEPLIMATVYAALVAPAAVGLIVGKSSPWTVLPLTLAATLLFFFATNLAVWWTWHNHDYAGLAICFTRALPFLKYSLAGDLSFTLALFSVYAAFSPGRTESRARSRNAIASDCCQAARRNSPAELIGG